MTPARPITIWAISSARCRPHGRTSICNIPGHLPAASPICAARSIAALLPDRHRHQRVQSQSLAAGLQRDAGFGGARAELRFLGGRAGHLQPQRRPLRDLFGHGEQDIRRHRCAPDGRLSHLRQYRHGGQPRPALRNQHLQIQVPQLSILADRTDRQRQGASTTSCNGPRACSSSTRSSPNDGGFLYQFLPSAAGPPTAAAGKQFSITDWSNNSEQNSSYAAYAQATYSIWSDTRFTAGVRYTYDERFAHIASQTIRTPGHRGDHRDR